MTFSDGSTTRAAAAAQVFVDDLEALDLTGKDARHLLRVRRLRDDEVVIAADNTGAWRCCQVRGGGLVAAGAIEFEPERTPTVTVALAPVKGERTEWAVAKLTELGCDRIVALATTHAAVHWSAPAADKALGRWTRIAREASCQSRRVRLPLIEGPLPVSAFVGEPAAAMAVPGGPPVASATTTVLVGPEGGWSNDERSLGMAEVGLAGNVLRTETAAVSAGVLLEALRAGTVVHRDNRGGVR